MKNVIWKDVMKKRSKRQSDIKDTGVHLLGVTESTRYLLMNHLGIKNITELSFKTEDFVVNCNYPVAKYNLREIKKQMARRGLKFLDKA